MLELRRIAFLLRLAFGLGILDEEVFMAEGVQKTGLALLVFRPDGLDWMKAVLVLEEILREAFCSS